MAADDAVASATRSRSNTTGSAASSASEISLSSARSLPPPPEHAPLQKEWGKPIRLAAKENPLGMSVFKLAGKDGKGSWFARRSVHEGLGFSKWKKGLEREFPESLEVQGNPGDGNIRGIGGERLVESRTVKGLGKLQVYHLSAQFPGPTAPRDFVTLLLTSSAALNTSRPWRSESALDPSSAQVPAPPPRHYMVISKPCVHPQCPPRPGYVRGEYESIEFIREVPVKAPPPPAPIGRPRASSSASAKQATSPSRDFGSDDAGESETTGRPRGKTISFAERLDASASADGQAAKADNNPVEWIMITRSDPGGNVPRWMVERGTPSSIVADAGKFLDWACKTEHVLTEDDDDDEGEQEGDGEKLSRHPTDHRPELHAVDTNGHLSGLDGTNEGIVEEREEEEQAERGQQNGGGLLSSMTSAVGAGLSAVTPRIVSSRLGSSQVEMVDSESDTSETSSIASFATASVGEDDAITNSTHTASSMTPPSAKTVGNESKDGVAPPTPTPQAKELMRLQLRRRQLDEQLEKTRAASTQATSQTTAKEAAALVKAEERHAREVNKQEERYAKELAKIEARRQKEERKAEEKRRKQEYKDERARGAKERGDLRKEVEGLKSEREALKGVIGDLQRENTNLVMKMAVKSDGPGRGSATGSVTSLAPSIDEVGKSLKGVPSITTTPAGAESSSSALALGMPNGGRERGA